MIKAAEIGFRSDLRNGGNHHVCAKKDLPSKFADYRTLAFERGKGKLRFPFRRMISRKGLNFGCVKLANWPKNGCHIEA